MAMLFDPGGRMGRAQLLVAASAMLVIEVALLAAVDAQGALPVIFWPLRAVAYWIGTVAIIKRLHDVGCSGWWLLAGAGGLCMWAAVLGVALMATGGFAALQPGHIGHVILLAALMLPAIGMTLWLHLAAGEPGMNRFGPAPVGLPSQPGEVPGVAAGR